MSGVANDRARAVVGTESRARTRIMPGWFVSYASAFDCTVLAVAVFGFAIYLRSLLTWHFSQGELLAWNTISVWIVLLLAISAQALWSSLARRPPWIRPPFFLALGIFWFFVIATCWGHVKA